MKSSRFKVKSWAVSVAMASLTMFASTSAHAVDGCKFLLCIAGPWTSISQCVGTVKQVFRDLARGKPFPTCNMSGGGNAAGNTWVDQQSCPSMYRQYDYDGNYAGCSYPGRIDVYVSGALWSQVYWDMGGNTSTWYSGAARSSLTQTPGSAPLDDAFLNDLNGWNSAQVAQCTNAGGTVDYDMFGAFTKCNYLNWWGGGGS